MSRSWVRLRWVLRCQTKGAQFFVTMVVNVILVGISIESNLSFVTEHIVHPKAIMWYVDCAIGSQFEVDKVDLVREN